MELAARTVTGPFVDGVVHVGTVDVDVVVLLIVVPGCPVVVVAATSSVVADTVVVATTVEDGFDTAAPPPQDTRSNANINDVRADRDPITDQPPR